MLQARLEQWLTRQWRQRGLWARLTWPLHRLMLAVVTHRRRHGPRRAAARLPVPVIVVGNRIVGGAGKTPVTLALLEHLKARGWHPGVLSRGHGRQAGTPDPLLLDTASAPGLSAATTGDECWLIHHRAGVPVGISPRRHAAGLALLAAHPEVDVLVCDDALQHLELARDVELVVFDERGQGNGWLLPAGLLREPIDAPAGPGTTHDPLVVYTGGAPSTALDGHVAMRSLQRPVRLADWQGGRCSPDPAQPAACGPDGPGVAALAGIAQPERFFDALRAQGLKFSPIALADHARFDPLPWPADVRHLLVTEKDAVKIEAAALRDQRPDTRVWVVPLTLTLPASLLSILDARLTTVAGASPVADAARRTDNPT